MIFLSYSWKDQSVVHRIDAALRRRGLDVWIDFRDLDPRLEIRSQLETAIRSCSLFLAFQPPDRQNSPWMTVELLMAIAHARPILQFPAGLKLPGRTDTLSLRSLLYGIG